MKGDATGQGVVPLRTILRNILNLIDSFEARYKEGLDSYDQEFQELKQYSENLKTDPGYLCKEGEKTVNRKKNRYKDILPFDYTRVILGDYGDIPGSDYINANFIKGASGSSAYIACQGPLPHTVNDYWRMVVECEVQVIVMACNEQESGKHKCENYWVEEEGVEREFGQVTVWLKKSRQVCPDFLVRTMKIRYPNSKGESEERSVCQFHYSAWPDHGVPLKVRPLLDMVRLIRDCQTSETLPVLVHCSAGCGRTGTICAIDYVWGLLRLGKLTSDFSLFNLVRDMRRQRIAMVQTKDQYILVHRAVRELFEEQLKIIDSHPYANVDINGLPLEIRADLEEPVYETVQFAPSTVKLGEDMVESRKPNLCPKPLPPPIPSEALVSLTSSVATSKHEKEAENHQRQMEQEKMKVNVVNGSSSSISIKVNSTTPSPSSESQGGASGSESKDTSDREKDIISVPDEKANGKRDGGSGNKPKSSLLRNPSIVRLKAFFEKSKDPDKEKKAIPTLSRAKSDVSSSSRFYANLASTFTSRASRRNPPVTAKNISSPIMVTSSIEEPRQRTPVEKIKSKPALLAKPNIAVKRSKSLRIVRPNEEPVVRDHVQLISANSISSEMPDSSKLVRASISSTSSSSSQSPLESRPMKMNVKKGDLPKLQKPTSKSMKTVPTSQEPRKEMFDKDFSSFAKSKKPDVPMKPHLVEMTPPPKSVYGPTRIKIGTSDDMAIEKSSSASKLNGKIKKYGTVNSKILSPPGTLLTRSQSHVWQPSKTQTQVPIRIFSDENLSQVGIPDCRTTGESNSRGMDQTDSGVKLIRKQSLPITKLFSSKVTPHPVNSSYDSSPPSKEQPRSLTLTSHSSFLEARKRVPKTNPYANYTPGTDNQSYKEKGGGGSPLAQFHFGDNVPLLKNSSGNANMGNSSESSSNPGTPRNSLPGTPTQSIDVLYSPLSLNTTANYSSSKNHSRPILKGSLSSTPSESDERLDLSRPHVTSSAFQSQVPTNITGPQKISSVRIPVGMRERRNSFRQAVWKEDQGPTATSIPVEKDKSENIYITTTSSVPYFVKSSAMPMHNTNPVSNSGASYKTPVTTTTTSSANSGISRPHRDYEPIWPDPASSTNSFKIGPAATSTTTVLINADPHSHVTINKAQTGSFNINSTNPFLSDQKAPMQNKFEPKVQDRMAEIKVLLEELRAPSKVEEAKQRSHNGPSQIPLRKPVDKMPRTFMAEKSNGSAGTPMGTSASSATPSGLKHHRSLRAPSRPQYEQGFACFTFRKPSSFESITDQLYAEDNMHLARNHGKDNNMSSSTSYEPSKPRFQEDSFQNHQQQGDTTGGYNHRLNDYVSLRTCRSASATRAKPDGMGPPDPSQQLLHHQQLLGNSEAMPIPPPRSKRMGNGRRDQGNDYANVSVSQAHKPAADKYGGWMENGVGNNHHPHRLHNGTNTTAPMAIRKESSSSSSELDQYDNHYNGNGQEYSRLTSTSSIPLTNGNSANVAPTSPKAIIRALGLFQAKAANVRSRFASWTESKERSASKRGNNYGQALTKRQERSGDRGGFNETHPSRTTAAPPTSLAGPSSTSKHQYL